MTGSVAEVAETLVTEFQGEVLSPLVVTVVERAQADLTGQVPPGALPEMLERLARQRLTLLIRPDA